MIRNIVIFGIVLFFGFTATSQKVNHALFDVVLSEYVSENGSVNYAKLSENKKQLHAYLNELVKNSPKTTWAKEEKLAYWINAYNAFTLKVVIDNYPIKSIKDIDNVWHKKFIPINGNLISLHYIEHTVLRNLNEPRIHFAINCASASCPKLLTTAYLPEKIYQQLDFATKAFITDTSKNNITATQLKLSKIFKWYKNDFDVAGGVVTFIQKYSDIEISDAVKISYLPYDWQLNE